MDFNYIIIVIWQSRQIKSLFTLKDRNNRRSHMFYKGDCSYGDRHIGETMRNVRVQIVEQSNTCSDSGHDPKRSCHLCANPLHSFSCTAQSFCMAKRNPSRQSSFNKHIQCYMAKLLKSGIANCKNTKIIIWLPVGVTISVTFQYFTWKWKQQVTSTLLDENLRKTPCDFDAAFLPNVFRVVEKLCGVSNTEKKLFNPAQVALTKIPRNEAKIYQQKDVCFLLWRTFINFSW